MMESWPLVYIKWVDAYDGSAGWTSISDLDDWKTGNWSVEQVGWIYEETDDYIVLINIISEEQDSVAHRMKIPKPWILHREAIKLKKK